MNVNFAIYKTMATLKVVSRPDDDKFSFVLFL